MTSPRDVVLGAVRVALGNRTNNPAQTKADADALLQDPDVIRPELMAPDPMAAFIARATSPKLIGTSVVRIPSVADFPAAVASYLAAQSLPRIVALQPSPDLVSLDWSGIQLRHEMAADELVGAGVARCAIAETGSLVFHSDADTPILFNFLPLHHIVLVHAETILRHLEDYVSTVTGDIPPRNVNIITGASGTTDIEGVLVRGAHGPRNLHIVIALRGLGSPSGIR